MIWSVSLSFGLPSRRSIAFSMGFQFVSSRIHSSNSIRSLSFLQSLVLVTLYQSVQLLSHRVFCGIAPAGTAILGLHRHHEMMRSTLYIREDERVTSFRTTFPLCCILCCAQERPETLTCPKGVERHHHQRKTMKKILNGPVASWFSNCSISNKF